MYKFSGMWCVKLFAFSAFMFVIVLQTFGKTDVYIDSLDVKSHISPSKDTIWFVNSYYNEKTSSTDIKFRLKFKNYEELGITGNKVIWSRINHQTGANEGVYKTFLFNKLEDVFNFGTIEKGVYQLKFIFSNGGEAEAYFFNKTIDFDIVPVKVEEGDCLSEGADTCIFTLSNHRLNPKGTKYKMNSSLADEEILVDKEKPDKVDDVFFVIFNGPTGFNDLFLTVTGSYENPRNKKTIYTTKSQITPLRKYDRPDLQKIFSFDTLTPEHFKGCADIPLEALSYSDAMNKKYMDFMQLPDFKSKEGFEIIYFRKDSLNQANWDTIRATEKKEYITDSLNFSFLQSGIYRIWMTNSNYCGSDTLDTEVVSKSDFERQIRIYRNDVKQLKFEQNVLCLSGTPESDTLVIKDYAFRLNWEDPPTYNFSVYRQLKDKNGLDSLAFIADKDKDKYYTEVSQQPFYNEKGECDSTVLKYAFVQLGHYWVVLHKQSSECSSVRDSVFLKVAKVPSIGKDFLDGTEYLNMHEFCGEYKYQIPSEIPVDSNYAVVDKYEWKFSKGSYVQVFPDQKPGVEEIVFDSLTDIASYITLRAGNSCGWSVPDSVSFFTYETPVVELWRDSVLNNDTLCSGKDYQYYFKGVFPQHFQITPGNVENDSVVQVFFPESGAMEEIYTIINTDHPNCSQEIKEELWLVSPPIFEVFDTIQFCNTTTEIQTHALLKSQLLNYKDMTWTFRKPSGVVTEPGTDFPLGFDVDKEKDFPRFSVSADTMILEYWVSNGGGGSGRGKGCSDENEIMLIRNPEPELSLKHDQKWTQCENKEFAIEGVLGSDKKKALHLQIRIDGEQWFNSADGDWDIKDYPCPVDKDSVKIVFEASQKHTYPGSDGCDLSDSVFMYIDHPRIHFQKNDTLYDNSRIYDFSRMKNHTDTSDVVNLLWEVVRGHEVISNGGNDVFNHTYNFHKETPGDSILLRLYGNSLCGDIVDDTLAVYFPETKLYGGVAELCDNVKEYPLWSHVPSSGHAFGYFIDTTSLEWSITSGDGTIRSGRSDARFVVPENGLRGSTIIHLKALDIDGNSCEEDLIVHIYKAPRLVMKKDFPGGIVLAAGDSLVFSKISDVQNAGLSLWEGTGGGKLGNNNWYLPFYQGHSEYADSLIISMGVLKDDQKGCGTVIKDTLRLIIFPAPEVSIDKDSLKMCAGDHLRIGAPGNGLITVEGYDDLVLNWKTRSGCVGCLENQDDINYGVDFNSPGAGDEIVLFSATKDVVNYEGKSRNLLGMDSVVIRSHGKPVFEISKSRDTICFNTTDIDISGISVATTGLDLLRFVPGNDLLATGVNYKYQLPLGADDSARIYIYAIQEGCNKWKNNKDSISVVRLPELKGVLLRPDDLICSNQDLAVSATTNTQRFSWKTTNGGLLLNEETLQPTYRAIDGIIEDTIVFTALPMLGKCTDRKVAKEVLQIIRFPDLQWVDDTLCADVNEYQLSCDGGDLIEAIEWSASSGGAFQNGQNQIPDPVYLISEADKNAGEVTLTAKIRLKSPCEGEGTVIRSKKLKILEIPQMSVNGGPVGRVCQGDVLDIDFVTYSSVVSEWIWNTPAGHFEDETIGNPRFYPGENSGELDLKVTLISKQIGSHFCLNASLPVRIMIDKAEKPDIMTSESVCQGIEVGYIAGGSTDINEYKWVSDGGEEKTGEKVTYLFEESGKKWVDLQVAYNNGCYRTNADTIDVLERSAAKFKPDALIVGMGKEVNFINQSEDYTSQWWYVDGVNLSDDPDFRYTFPSSGVYKVGLEVENNLGCRDTNYQEIRVLLKPMARFAVALEDPAKPCDHSKAVFTNLTGGAKEYYSYKWILNTNTTGVDTTGEIPVGDVYYKASENQDTIYKVTLIVENAAGIDTAEYQSLKIVSHITARFDPANVESGCAGFDRVFMNRTKGSADWYKINWGDGRDTTFSDRKNGILRHKYTNDAYEPREDTVRFSVGNVCEEDSVKLVVRISPNTATAKIQPDPLTGTEGCYMFEPEFHNISIGFGGVQKALWDFGEGNPVVENNGETVSNLYEKPGIYTVVLTIFDECNKSTDTLMVNVKGNDQLSYVMKENIPCSGQPITFEVNPEIQDQFYEYYWNFDFGGATNAWVQKDKLTVVQSWREGTYKVALKAKSKDGCDIYNPYFKTIEVKETPLADFEFRYAEEQEFRDHGQDIEGCNPLSIQFRNIGANEKDIIFWDFNDGGTSQERFLEHAFVAVGASSFKLKVTSENGCIDSLVKNLIVRESPDASFKNLAGNLFCKDGLVHLNVENTGLNQENTTYLWSYQKPDDAGDVYWDDKTVPSEKDFENVFGKVVLKLKATHKVSGCSKVKTDTLISSPAISHHFSIEKEKICDGEDIHFEFAANQGDQVRWKLGDASPDVTENAFTYAYDRAGEYVVNLNVRNKYGCQQDTVRTVYVYPLPKADFGYEKGYAVVENLPEGIDISTLPDVPNGNFQFNNYSNVPSFDFCDSHLNYYWNFGDDSLVVLTKDPSHHFDNNGQYAVKLLVKTTYGCVDSVSESLSIDAVKGLFIPNAFAPGAGAEENPGVALFKPKGIGLLSYKIRVYDGESGTCVWMSDKLEDGRPAEAWDGTFNGQPLPKKLYEWVVSAVFMDGSVWTGEKGYTKGIVMLIR